MKETAHHRRFDVHVLIEYIIVTGNLVVLS